MRRRIAEVIGFVAMFTVTLGVLATMSVLSSPVVPLGS